MNICRINMIGIRKAIIAKMMMKSEKRPPTPSSILSAIFPLSMVTNIFKKINNNSIFRTF
jgi:hypothetical protein